MRKMNKKLIVAVIACATLIVGSITSSLAWLVDQTDDVTNTFTYSDINVGLSETTDNYKMVPGFTIAKDPMVTLETGSETSFVFVKITKSENYETYLAEYVVNDEWKLLTEEGNTAVYYKVMNAGETSYVLKGGHDTMCTDPGDTCGCANKHGFVTVLQSVTKTDMEAIKTSGMPTLTFKAYAIQYYSTNGVAFEPSAAWAIINPTNP